MWFCWPRRIIAYISLTQKLINSSMFHYFWSFKLAVVHTDNSCIATMELFSLFAYSVSSVFLSPSFSPPILDLIACHSLIWPFEIWSAEVTAGPVLVVTLWWKRWYFSSHVMTVLVFVMADLCMQETKCIALIAHFKGCFQTESKIVLRTTRESFLSLG